MTGSPSPSVVDFWLDPVCPLPVDGVTLAARGRKAQAAAAVRVFDGARLLAGYPQFFELERTRVRPPVFN